MGEPFAKPVTVRKSDGYRFRLRSSSYGGQVAPPILSADASLAMTGSQRAVDHDLDQFRAGPLECRRQRGRHVLGLRNALCLEPERFCQACKIHRRVDKIHADVMIVAVK